MYRNKTRLSYQIILLISMILSTRAFAGEIPVGRFSENNLEGWEEKSFSGHSRYQLIQTPQGSVLQASTSGSASGMFREFEIDLDKTPYLNWSWKIDNIYQGNDEQSKDGDDYPARIYVVVSGGLFFWKTRAINYVWSSNQNTDSTWNNAYTDNARMIAVRAGDQQTGQWLTEKRNVKKDLKRLFGVDISRIHAVAIMSDSDNSKQSATAYYGDIYFSDK